MMLVDVIRDHFRFLFANHRNQHCVIAVLNKMENWLEEDKGLRWSMETGCQVWKIDRIHAGAQAAWIQKSRVTRTVDCTLMLQGSMPPHFSHSSPQALNCPEAPSLLSSCPYLDSSHFTSSLFSWDQWCCKSFSQLCNLKQHSLQWDHSHFWHQLQVQGVSKIPWVFIIF